MRILLGVLALLVAFAFGPASAAQPAKKAARTTFDEHILPILKDRCVSCHSQDKKRGGLVLNNYLKMMEGGSSGVCVKPGDAEGSALYRNTAHLAEPFMPPKADKIAQKEIDLIKKWIDEGAAENSGSKAVAVKPKVDFSLSSVTKGKPAGPPPMPPATMSKEFVVKATQETAVTALAASPWAPLVAVGGQKQVLLYNSDNLQLLGVIPFPEGTPNVLKFSRNGSLLVIGGGHAGKSGRVVIWSVTKAERLFAVGEETDSVCAADISPDQTRIALGGPNRVIRIFSTKTGQLENEIRKHTEWVTALEFSPDGVLLATGDRNGGLFVWEAFTAREFFTLKGHTASITDISWRADSNIVASSSEDTTVRLFEMENGNQVRAIGANGGGSLSVNYSKDGKLVTAGRDKLARLWDGNNGVNTRNFEPFADVSLKAVFSHDAARVIAADWTGQIVVWNTADAKRVGTLSAVPPNFPVLLAAAQKALGEKQKAYDAVAGIAKASEAISAKTNADVAAAQKAVLDTVAALKVAEVKLAQTRAGVVASETAVKNAQAEVRAKEVLSQALTEASTKVKAEADKAKDNASLQAALTRTVALAGQASAETTLARKALSDTEAASRIVGPTLAPAQVAFNAAQAAAAEAPKKVPALLVAQKAAQAKTAADKALADKAMAELTPARTEVARLQAMMAVAQKK